jgi:hypothetical protein
LQTFLPYANFAYSASLLDTRRLGKQRVEGRQIQNALQNGGGWANHPATKMWAGHVESLMLYTDCCIREWIDRGYENTMTLMIVDLSAPFVSKIKPPKWLGDEAFHASHRSALLAKDPEFYGQYGWTDEPKIDYVWPRS